MTMTFALVLAVYVAVSVFVLLNSIMEAHGSYAGLRRHLWTMLVIAFSWPLIALAWPFMVRAKPAGWAQQV